MANVSFVLNGTEVSVDAQGTLLTALRDHLRIPSVKTDVRHKVSVDAARSGLMGNHEFRV
jgi:aerobic-type carbon monoxide dehydrogenase small subunit (CoxS/CutS family)